MRDVIDLIKSRDEKGLAMLYDNYAPALLGIIVRIVKDKRVGEEILQSTFLKIWDSINMYDPDKGNFFTWLATIARRKAIDTAKLKGHQRRLDNEDLSTSTYNMLSTSDLNAESIDAQRLLSALNDNHRVILDMVYLQGFTHKETAKTLEIPLGTVKSRLRIAIKLLRDSLENEKELFLGFFLLLILIIGMFWA